MTPLWQNSGVMHRRGDHGTQTKIAFCPQALPWRTGRVWVPCEALHSPPHLAAEPCPMTRRRGVCRSHSNTHFTPPWLSFAYKLLKTGLRSPDSRPGQTPLREARLRLGPEPGISEGLGLRAVGC